MADNTTFSRVVNIIAGQLGAEAENITLTTDIQSDLGADSLDIAEMLIAFEEEFDVGIDESDAQDIKTVGDVVKHIDAAISV